jgi:hypothetical protein
MDHPTASIFANPLLLSHRRTCHRFLAMIIKQTALSSASDISDLEPMSLIFASFSFHSGVDFGTHAQCCSETL